MIGSGGCCHLALAAARPCAVAGPRSLKVLDSALAERAGFPWLVLEWGGGVAWRALLVSNHCKLAKVGISGFQTGIPRLVGRCAVWKTSGGSVVDKLLQEQQSDLPAACKREAVATKLRTTEGGDDVACCDYEMVAFFPFSSLALCSLPRSRSLSSAPCSALQFCSSAVPPFSVPLPTITLLCCSRTLQNLVEEKVEPVTVGVTQVVLEVVDEALPLSHKGAVESPRGSAGSSLDLEAFCLCRRGSPALPPCARDDPLSTRR